MMATYGIQTQTPHEVSFIISLLLSWNSHFSFILFTKVEPVQIWSSTQLIKIFQELGVNEKIGLTGRPNRPVGSLGTSKVRNLTIFSFHSINWNYFDRTGVSCLWHDRIMLSADI